MRVVDQPRRDEAASGPLEGLRVVDLSTSYAGPTGSMYLADLGADVIKVERPAGDEARDWGPPFHDGMSAWFASANRNKRSIAVDLRSEGGREVLHALVRDADVFIQSVNPAKLAKLGIDPDTIRTLNPRIIYCAMSGFGLDGPAAARPGYDLAAQARSGLMSVTGAAGGLPQRVSTALSDIVTGMCAALAISAATVRQRTEGVGDVIDVSLLDSDLALMAPRIASYVAGEPEPKPTGGTDSVLAVYQAFTAADRQVVIAIGNDPMWRRFANAVGLSELADDPELQSNASRRKHRSRITKLVNERMQQRTAAEWLELLASVDVPASLVQSLSEVVADEQVVARGSVMPVPSREGLSSVRSPFRLQSAGEARNEGVPDVGQHTREILLDHGFASDRITDLLRDGAVTEPATTEPEMSEELRAHG